MVIVARTAKNKRYVKKVALDIAMGNGNKAYENFIFSKTQEYMEQHDMKIKNNHICTLEDIQQQLLFTECASTLKIDLITYKNNQYKAPTQKLSFKWKGENVTIYQDKDECPFMYIFRQDDPKHDKRRIYLESFISGYIQECLDSLPGLEKDWQQEWKEIELAANKMNRKKEMIVNAFSGMLKAKMRGSKIPYHICVQQNQMKVIFKVGKVEFFYTFSYKKYLEQIDLAVASLKALRDAMECYSGIIKVCKNGGYQTWIYPDE